MQQALRSRAAGRRGAVALLSCFLVLKGWSLMGDAVSHAVLPGIVLAYIARHPARHRRLRRRHVLRAGDRLPQGEQPHQGGHGDGRRLLRHVRRSASCSTRKIQTEVHLDHILFGDMLGVTLGATSRETRRDRAGRRWPIGARSAARPAAASPSTRSMPAPIGLPVRLLHYGLLALLSLTIVGALKAVGIILAIALLISPGAIAFLLTDRFERMLAVSDLHRRAGGLCRASSQLLHRCRSGRLDRRRADDALHPGLPVRPEARGSLAATPARLGRG